MPAGVGWAAGAVVLLLLLALAATTLVGSGSDGENAAFDSPTTTAVPAVPPPSVAPAVTGGGMTADPGALRFADQTVGTASPKQTVTVASSGGSAVRPGDASVEGPGRDSFSVEATSCTGAVLPPGSRCTVDVIFHPPAAGDRAAALRLGARDGPAVALSGRGVEGVSTPTGMPGPTPSRPNGGPATAPRSQTTSTTAGLNSATALVAAEADLAVVVEACNFSGCESRVKVTNNGPATADGVQLTYQATGLTISVTDPRCSKGSCSLGTLTRDQSEVTFIRVSGTSGVLTVTASANQTDPVAGNNEAKRNFTFGPG